MKNLLTFGLVVSFFLIPFGCAHTPDSPAVTPQHQEIAAAPTAAQTNGTPTLELSETTFDFGLVGEGSDYIHVFKIRNVGTGDLVIRKIMPG
jgi:hypothetical protein